MITVIMCKTKKASIVVIVLKKCCVNLNIVDILKNRFLILRQN